MDALENPFQQELFLSFWSRPRLGPLREAIAVGVLGSGRAQIIGGSSQWLLLRKEALDCRGTGMILKSGCWRGL